MTSHFPHPQLATADQENINVIKCFKDGITKTQSVPKLGLSARNVNLHLNVVKAQCEPAPQQRRLDVVQMPRQTSESLEKTVLPPNVADIDEGDDAYLEFSAVYVKDIYQYLFKLETRNVVKQQYLLKHPALKAHMRMILIEWLVSLQTRFRLLQETLLTTVSILDRFMSETDTEVARSKFQLVGLTCLLIACKYEEMYLPSIEDLAFMCDGAYKTDDIIDMERRILTTIQFDLSKPLSAHFLRRFSKAGSADSLTHTLAKYFLELALYEYSLVHCNPSAIAAASLYIASLVTESVRWDQTVQYYSTYKAEDLKYIIRKLSELGMSAPSNKYLKTTFKKYAAERFWNVSKVVAENSRIQKLVTDPL